MVVRSIAMSTINTTIEWSVQLQVVGSIASGWHHHITPTSTHFISLLRVVQTQPTPPCMMVHHIAMSTIMILSLGVVQTWPTPSHYSSTPTLK